VGDSGSVELLFILAITDGIGGEAISKRVREQWERYQSIQKAGLTLSTSYRLLGAVKRQASEPMEGFVERVSTNVQGLLDEEISLRTVRNGQ
jgi:hypothetical protein